MAFCTYNNPKFYIKFNNAFLITWPLIRFVFDNEKSQKPFFKWLCSHSKGSTSQEMLASVKILLLLSKKDTYFNCLLTCYYVSSVHSVI